MLPSFDYQPLGRVVYEAGGLARLGALARELGGTRALLVTDPGLEKAGHPQRALASLRNAGLHAVVFDGVEENPTTRHVDDGLAVAQAERIDLLVSVGGGSAMDCAKGMNFLLTNGGRMTDYKGSGRATKPMLPSIGIPTTAGTGSEAQSFALIADEKTHLKMACGDRKVAFRAVILDPELTVSQPPAVAAITGIDALSHAVESYVTTRRNPLSRVFAREAWRLLERNLDLEHASYFLSRITITPSEGDGAMSTWRKKLFMLMARNAASPIDHFGLPANRTVIMGSQVEL